MLQPVAHSALGVLVHLRHGGFFLLRGFLGALCGPPRLLLFPCGFFLGCFGGQRAHVVGRESLVTHAGGQSLALCNQPPDRAFVVPRHLRVERIERLPGRLEVLGGFDLGLDAVDHLLLLCDLGALRGAALGVEAVHALQVGTEALQFLLGRVQLLLCGLAQHGVDQRVAPLHGCSAIPRPSDRVNQRNNIRARPA